ncbi:uncharacterized protein [Malus domestica]|uniref:uncharacterized protein n=1 Tax=Malus domestica TaxID=3750 RepID=UPI0007EDA9E8
MGSLLAQNNKGRKEQAIFYLSKNLTEVDMRYTPVERLCLALYFTACKLRHYMLPCHIHIIAKIDVIKYGVPEIIVTDRELSFISKEVEEFANSPEKWHEKLGDTLWAYRYSKRAATGTTPYALTFEQDVVLPMEINVSSIRIQHQFRLHSKEYIKAMCQEVEDLDVARIEALDKIQEGKRVVARAYNKKVKLKNFKK